eukprot:scaffold101006_cov31-Attheya_sp.AAC.2
MLTVWGLTRYSAGMGGAMALHQGRTKGFLGEVMGDQLPTIILMSDSVDNTMVDCVELKDYEVPSIVDLDAAFTGNFPR